MRKFNITTFLFILILAITFALSQSLTQKIVFCSVLFVVYLLILVWASANIKSNFFIKSILSNEYQTDKIAITFDDGPDIINTPLILELLKEYEIKATFFVIGIKARNNLNILKEIDLNQHLIANHSYSHSNWFALKSVKSIKAEIIETNKIIEQNTNSKNTYFRPPVGITNPLIYKAVKQLGYVSIGWSIRSLDTKNENADVVCKRIFSKIKGGDIVLLHDTSKNIVEILKRLLPYLQQKNLKSVTIDELLNTPK